MYCRQRSTLRRPDFGPKDGEHLIAGKMRPVEIYYRDYKSVNGLMVPYVLKTTVQAAKQSHNMTIENVVVKPKLEHSLFTVPKIK